MNTAPNVNSNLFNALFFNTEFESSLYTFFFIEPFSFTEENFIMTNTNSTTIIRVKPSRREICLFFVSISANVGCNNNIIIII